MINDVSSLLSELRAHNLVEHRHQNVELKQSWAQDVGKKISSNANKIHIPVSWIVLGVNDDGELSKHNEPWAKDTEHQLSGHLNQYLDPCQACHSTEAYVIGGHWILIIKVSNPGAIVYWNKKAYKSSGTTLSEMEPEETMELTVSLPGLKDFSAQPWNGTIDRDLVRQFAKRISRKYSHSHLADLHSLEPEAALRRLGILNTNVSRLLFSATPFRVIFYDAGNIPQRNETRTSLYALLTDEFRSEVDQWTRGARGTSQQIYLAEAFQEGVANAVAHAAYFEHDGELMVEVFVDRLCISNLCTRDSTYFANRWFSRSHKTLNNLLMETLRVAGHVDELGRGKNLIFQVHITNGRAAPQVHTERAGRYSRWRLMLPGTLTGDRHIRLLNALREHFEDEHKALIAVALVIWRNKPVKELRNYVDGESGPLFAEVLSDPHGATFFYEKDDRIVLNRWARLLLHEGVDSKSLTEAEEQHLLNLAYDLHNKFRNREITPQDVRNLAELGNTPGAHSLSCKLLKKWHSTGIVEKLKRGHFRFRPREAAETLKKQVVDLFTNVEQAPAELDVASSAK